MNKALEQAIEKIRTLPQDRQEYAASVLEEIAAEDTETYQLSDEERVLVREGLDDLAAGHVVTSAQMHAYLSSLRRK